MQKRENKKVIFIGSGDLAEICYLGVKEWGLELVAVYDNETDKKQFMGIKLKPFSEFKLLQDDLSSKLSNHQIIICTYDKSKPMTENYLPDVINQQLTTNNSQHLFKLHWIF